MESVPRFTNFRNRKRSSDRSDRPEQPDRDTGYESTWWEQGSSQQYYEESVASSSSGQEGYRHRRKWPSSFGEDGERSKHPPWLKGKDIGLYYRGLSLQKRYSGHEATKTEGQFGAKKRQDKESTYKGPRHNLVIELYGRKEREIQKLLEQVRLEGKFSQYSSLRKQDQSQPSSSLYMGIKTERPEVGLKPSNDDEYKSKMECSEFMAAFTGPCNQTNYVPIEENSMYDWQTVGSRPISTKPPNADEDMGEMEEDNQRLSCDQYKNMGDSAFKRNFLQSITESIEAKLDRTMLSESTLQQDAELDQNLLDSLLAKEYSPKYREMLTFREKLPAFRMKDEILNLINKHQVVVVSGETGCGKTTQLGQFILDEEIKMNRGSTCHVICTQPRRISATSVAKRVADERAEALGESVGYQIRLENNLPRKRGSLLFCTTGVLLQFMQGDPALRQVSHLVLDEIHERDTVCDFVITLLRSIIPKRPDLKVVLMSATLNAHMFSKYFEYCPCINIPGFTYAVTEVYLEDILEMTRFEFGRSRGKSVRESKWKKHTSKGKQVVEKEQVFEDMIEPFVRGLDTLHYSRRTIDGLLNPESENLNFDLIADLLHVICTSKPDGAILVFLPGWTDISSLSNTLTSRREFSSSRFVIIPLHSMMPSSVQYSVFDRPPPGVRKIVLATNIAETSVTIDDVVYVIDTGKIKMKQFDVETNTQTLLPEWISLANAKQRKGRAGRVRPGFCYRMYTRAREMTFESYPLPEILRSRLEEVILMAKVHQVGPVKSFLSRVMNPPQIKAVDIALQLLYTMNALDSNENLTPLGYHLAHLPLDPQTAKMILMAALFSCVDPVFSIAASLSFKDAFVTPLGMEKIVSDRKVVLSCGSKSDHLLLADTMQRWERASQHRGGGSFCQENFLSPATLYLLKDMKTQFARYLFDMKFLSSPDPKAKQSNVNSKNRSLVKAIICAGLYPNVAFVGSTKVCRRGVIQRLFTAEDGNVQLHMRSVNTKTYSFESPFLVYHLKLKSSAVYLHDTTMADPIPLLLFGEKLNYSVQNGVEMVAVNDYIRFRCRENTADIIKEIRHNMNCVLEHKVSHPNTVDWDDKDSTERAVFQAIVELIAYEDDQRLQGQQSSVF